MPSGTPAKQVSYLGGETIVALPAIDFDYQPISSLPADISIPGSIAALPETLPGEEPTPLAPSARHETDSYVVKSGDTIAAIAQHFGVDVATVIYANNLTSRSVLQPGDALKIPATSGLLYTIKRNDTLAKIAQTYDVSVSDITNVNRIKEGAALSLGQEILLPGALPLAETPTRTVVLRPSTAKPVSTALKPGSSAAALKPDIPIARIKNKALDLYQELTGKSDARAKPEDVPVADITTKSKLLWPTRLHVINQYYSWRHNGLDLDGDYTDPIYASDDGVVMEAGWSNVGYGLTIFIDHQNGFKTRYGHSSKLFVQKGDLVKRGQVIGMVGTTGRSTGTHLHFEVILNGKHLNPLSYIK